MKVHYVSVAMQDSASRLMKSLRLPFAGRKQRTRSKTTMGRTDYRMSHAHRVCYVARNAPESPSVSLPPATHIGVSCFRDEVDVKLGI